MNLPNVITVARILLIPVFIVLYMVQKDWSIFAASVLFALAAITDWLDGYLARRLNQTTPFGAFLDPVADKLLVVTVLIMLVGELNPLLAPTIVIIAREVLISALREWMATRGHREAVAVAFSGKLKTTFQMIAIVTLILVTESSPDWLLMTGFVMIYIAALLSLYSGLHYFKAARPYLTP